MMPPRRLSLVLSLFVVFAGCERSPSPSDRSTDREPPVQSDEAQAVAAIAGMLALAEEGRWDAYVDQYYGETHKFNSPNDRVALVERFEQQWREQVIDGLRQAASLVPVIDDEGRAVFRVDGREVFVLYRSDSGRWTFHL